ncbi:MAG: hypothetical protein J6A59_11255 [Lachnospiraceae bacterium]|nr:hypothetical protein [Lachnospiraceae bacterium]
MKIYTVVDIHDEELCSEYEQSVIALFEGEPEWKGEGYGMGWYGAEYFLNATMIGYYVIESKNIVDFKAKHIDGDYECIYTYDKVNIGGKLRAVKLKAKDNKQALKKFFNHEF